ncbi:MAG: hypothetical protein RIQ93_2022 [Verrucomicrobiota bacterium]|jgi:hypothetical protein
MARTYSYRIVVVNLGDERITENRIFDSSGEYNYGCGNIGQSGYAANAGPMETAPNDVFTVRWKDSEKREREEKFDLRERVKSSFKGEIVFVYGSDNKLAVQIWDSPKQYPIPPRPKS